MNKINRYDNFSKLRQVVLGQLNFSLLDMIENQDDKNFAEHNFYSCKETLDTLEKIFKQFEVEVFKPCPVNYVQAHDLVTPYFSLPAVRNSLAAFDNYLILENTIIEVPSIDPYNFFDYVQYQHIWKKFMNTNNKWISAPRPSHQIIDDDTECLFDAPCFEPIGNKILYTQDTTITSAGLEWVKNMFPKFQYHSVKNTKGHLDGYFSVIKPGVILSSIDKENLPEIFKTWEVITPPRGKITHRKVIDDFLQDDDFENTNLLVSCFNIDEENLVIFEHTVNNHLEMIKKIEKHNVNIIPIPMDSARFFGQGLSCITNAIQRDGMMENYF